MDRKWIEESAKQTDKKNIKLLRVSVGLSEREMKEKKKEESKKQKTQ
jgi:hypothetical protein